MHFDSIMARLEKIEGLKIVAIDSDGVIDVKYGTCQFIIDNDISGTISLSVPEDTHWNLLHFTSKLKELISKVFYDVSEFEMVCKNNLIYWSYFTVNQSLPMLNYGQSFVNGSYSSYAGALNKSMSTEDWEKKLETLKHASKEHKWLDPAKMLIKCAKMYIIHCKAAPLFNRMTMSFLEDKGMVGEKLMPAEY